MTRRSERFGLTPNDARALHTLDASDGKPMRSLADAWGSDASNGTWVVDRLERLGLAERRGLVTDRRVKLAVLTARGIKARDEILERSMSRRSNLWPSTAAIWLPSRPFSRRWRRRPVHRRPLPPSRRSRGGGQAHGDHRRKVASIPRTGILDCKIVFTLTDVEWTVTSSADSSPSRAHSRKGTLPSAARLMTAFARKRGARCWPRQSGTSIARRSSTTG